jgi:hypothetical protein
MKSSIGEAKYSFAVSYTHSTLIQANNSTSVELTCGTARVEINATTAAKNAAESEVHLVLNKISKKITGDA